MLQILLVSSISCFIVGAYSSYRVVEYYRYLNEIELLSYHIEEPSYESRETQTKTKIKLDISPYRNIKVQEKRDCDFMMINS